MRFKQKLSSFYPYSSTIMSMDAGYVYPAFVRECYPNDRLKISHEALLKSAPMLFPIYSPMKLRFDYFYNENRNVWRGDEAKDWSAFIFNSVDGKPITDPTQVPLMPTVTFTADDCEAGSLADYLGFNTESAMVGAKVSALRFRHYNQIVNNFYLDENFSTKLPISLTEGPDTITSRALAKRCWNKDRFTTAAASPQAGVSIGIPLSDDIPIVYENASPAVAEGAAAAVSMVGYQNFPVARIAYQGSDGIFHDFPIGGTGDLKAKLSEATSIPIDTLHFVTQIERLNQQDNFWGTRDFEAIRTHFGITVPDTRLQRPTHLGYSVVDVHFSEVLQTSQTTTGSNGSPQGNITGHTMAVDKTKPVKYLVREHGYLFIMVTLMPIAQYQQGVPRDALYQTRYDYMWPLLSETGEQEIFEAEIRGTASNIASRKIFGFEPRYNHLRFGEKTVHGDFRTSLVGYHTGRIFDSDPNLNEQFITADPTKRMFAVEFDGVQPWWLRVEFEIQHTRRLPKWPTPSAIGKLF
uniref:Major capsid protein n=1 Tax=Dulem virus 76 TaxID=3145787 RepID=A0AAU8B9R3_9VIRU